MSLPSNPASDLGSHPTSNTYMLNIYCAPGIALRTFHVSSYEVFIITPQSRSHFPFYRWKEWGLKRSCSHWVPRDCKPVLSLTLSPWSLFSATHWVRASSRALFAQHQYAPAGGSGLRVEYGSFMLFHAASLLCYFFHFTLIALISKSSSSGRFSPFGRKLYPFYRWRNEAWEK